MRQTRRGLRAWALLPPLLLLLLVALSALQCTANTEIVNFGPLLCRADERGREDLVAADRIAAAWPTLRTTDREGLFTLTLSSAQEASAPLSSRTGAWLKLELSPEAPWAPLVEVQRSSIPRDRFAQDVWHAVSWFATRRFTVRVSTAANHAADVRLRVVDAHEMLAAGKMQRVAEVADAESDSRGDQAHGAAASPVIRIGEEPASGADVAFDADGRPVPSTQARHAPLPNDASEEADLLPCTVAYLQVIATRSGVRIPRNADCQRAGDGPARQGALDRAWRWISAHYFDRLAWDAGLPCDEAAAEEPFEAPAARTIRDGNLEITVSGADSDEGDAGTAPELLPIMLAFEPLHLGLIPAAATYTLFLLVVVCSLAYRFVLPRVQAHLEPHVASLGAPKEKAE